MRIFDIEDINPLIRAHYHAHQAGNLDAANKIISEVCEYLQQWNCAELVCANLQLPLLTEVKNISLSGAGKMPTPQEN